jgi:hypothetical protein
MLIKDEWIIIPILWEEHEYLYTCDMKRKVPHLVGLKFIQDWSNNDIKDHWHAHKGINKDSYKYNPSYDIMIEKLNEEIFIVEHLDYFKKEDHDTISYIIYSLHLSTWIFI